jgi:hypothetical protein
MRFLFRQKFRFEKGLCIMPAINFCLLCLSASDRIQRAVSVSTTVLLASLLPLVFTLVWSVGYCLTTPRMQAAEDSANADLNPWRRELTEIKRKAANR